VGEDVVDVAVGGALAGDRHGERGAIRRLDDLEQPRRALLAVAADPDRDHRRAPARPDQRRIARLDVAARVVDDAAALHGVEHVAHLVPERAVADPQRRRADEQELVHVLLSGLGREVPADRLVAALRLRVRRDLALVREHVAERGRRRRGGEHEHDRPGAEGRPRPPRAGARDASRREPHRSRGSGSGRTRQTPGARCGTDGAVRA
jgi:hypothetical protein